ncbi:MAG: histidine triad nucleotide-binding protein [Acidobacteriota bacterium]
MTHSTNCIFCRIVAGEMGKIIHEDDLVAAFEDLNPQAPHHTLIVPRRHLESLDQVGPAEEPLAGRLLSAEELLARRKGLHVNGYRVVFNTGKAAGQSVSHLHLHLLGGRDLRWPPG